MEKFTKFDDPSCGLNPFIHLQKSLPKNQQLAPWQAWARWICKGFLLALRLPCIFLALLMWWSLALFKYFLLVPILIRFMERFIDKMIAQLLLNVTSFNNIKEQYHREDASFDFTKWQKKELVVKKLDGDVFVTN